MPSSVSLTHSLTHSHAYTHTRFFLYGALPIRYLAFSRPYIHPLPQQVKNSLPRGLVTNQQKTNHVVKRKHITDHKKITQCLNLCILSAILLGILYLFFGAFPLVFQHNHGFTLAQTGLSFLGLFVGMLVGIASDPLWRACYDRLVRRQQGREEGGGSEPEFRLPSTVVGAWVVPVALFGTYLYFFPLGFEFGNGRLIG